MNILDLTERWSSAKNTQALFGMFAEEAAEYGYTYIAYADLPGRPSGNRRDREMSFPQPWLQRYNDQDYETIDPVVDLLLREQVPFEWEEMLNARNLTPEQKKVMDEAADEGLFSGMSVPLHGPRGEACGISLARNVKGHVDKRVTRACGLLSYYFHGTYSVLKREHPEENRELLLTLREREVLFWCAQGKSNWAIGEILGISGHSVKFHLRNTCQKLGVDSRIAAVVKAIRVGLIQP